MTRVDKVFWFFIVPVNAACLGLQLYLLLK